MSLGSHDERFSAAPRDDEFVTAVGCAATMRRRGDAPVEQPELIELLELKLIPELTLLPELTTLLSELIEVPEPRLMFDPPAGGALAGPPGC